MPTRRSLLAAIPRLALLLFVGLVANGFVLIVARSASRPVPMCDGQSGRPAHPQTAWHPLVAYAADGKSVLCTYGHEHGMNPAAADALFGAWPAGQSISYPWATVSSSGVPENGPDIKHRVYKWLVDTSMACDGSNPSVTAMREEFHADGNLGAGVRFHSFAGQYRMTNCATGQSGFMFTGGHMDYAKLTAGDNVVPLAIDPPASCPLNGDSRQEGGLGQVEQANSVWYGSSSRPGTPVCDYPSDNYTTPSVSIQVNVGTDGWGPVDPTNPSAIQFYQDRGNHHGTGVSTDAITIYVSNFPLDARGLAQFKGHTDRHGNVVAEVAGKPEGMDYIPLILKDVYQVAPYTVYGGPPSPFGFGYDGDVPGPNGEPGYYVQDPVAVSSGPTSTPTMVVVPPTSTPTTIVPSTATSTPPPRTPTATTVPATATATAASVPATNTPTSRPTSTPTMVVVPPTSTPTTIVPSRATSTPPPRTHTATTVPATATATAASVPATNTPTSRPTSRPTRTPTSTPSPRPHS